MSATTQLFNVTMARSSQKIKNMSILWQAECPICKKNTKQVKKIKTELLGYINCEHCNHFYLEGFPHHKDLLKYYEENHTVQGELCEKDRLFYHSLFDEPLDTIKRLGIKTILDIGCSTGVFLEYACGMGFNVEGMEINKAEADIARTKLFTVYNEHPIKLYDLITMWDVYEHLPDPFMLREYFNTAKYILIQTPTPSSIAARTLRGECRMFDGFEHLNLYTHDSIKAIIKRSQANIIYWNEVIDESQVVQNFLNYKNPYDGIKGNANVKGDYKLQIIIESSW